jgi:hypothetical protein
MSSSKGKLRRLRQVLIAITFTASRIGYERALFDRVGGS